MIVLSSIQILIIYAIHIFYYYITSLSIITQLLITYSIIVNTSLSHYSTHFAFESSSSATIFFASITIIYITSIMIYSIISSIISTTIALIFLNLSMSIYNYSLNMISISMPNYNPASILLSLTPY